MTEQSSDIKFFETKNADHVKFTEEICDVNRKVSFCQKTHWLSGKEKVLVTAVSTEDHADIANGPGDRGSIPGRVIPKTKKIVLDASLLNTQYFKVRIKGKVEQS